ncbi:MAG: G1 family endopeptidase [Candidatus Bathyarchaeota archaeon]|nr:G1 family endopeptidase [Candidatus Termiticorpusculum sp.]
MDTFGKTAEVHSLVSLTWSGYVAASDFSSPLPEVIGVNASWIVPSVSISSDNTYSSAWIGIGGQFDTSLIQIGTEHDSVNGKERYIAWYELLPDYAINIPIMISEGDMMSASINLVDKDTNLWFMQLTDVTTGESFSKSVNYNSTLLTAEWIVERPTLNGQIANLSNFGSVTFTEAYVNINHEVLPLGEVSFSQTHLTDNQNTQLTTVSQINSDGKSFTIQYIANG